MKSLVNHFETSKGFWEEHPELKLAGAFKVLYDKDDTTKRARSSRIMWYVALCVDPKSKFSDLPDEGTDSKWSILGKDMMSKPNYHIENAVMLHPIIEFYNKMVETPALRALKSWKKKMEERQQLYDDTSYTLDNVELLDKMVGATPKLMAELDRIEEKLTKEKIQAGARGAAPASLSDSGEI